MVDFSIILKVLGTIIILLGVIFVYDARKLTEKYCKKYDINIATKKIKLVGYVAFIVGCVLFLF